MSFIQYLQFNLVELSCTLFTWRFSCIDPGNSLLHLLQGRFWRSSSVVSRPTITQLNGSSNTKKLNEFLTDCPAHFASSKRQKTKEIQKSFTKVNRHFFKEVGGGWLLHNNNQEKYNKHKQKTTFKNLFTVVWIINEQFVCILLLLPLLLIHLFI